MSTSERVAAPGVPGQGFSEADIATALAREIERLANQLFAGPLPEPPRAPPNPGPSAVAVGAGGTSPALDAPPLPGAVKQPPLAVAPPPKESDLRVLPAILSDTFGLPSPMAAATTAQESSVDRPYYLQIADAPVATVNQGALSSAPSPPGPGARAGSSSAADIRPSPEAPGGVQPDLALPRTRGEDQGASNVPWDSWDVPVAPTAASSLRLPIAPPSTGTVVGGDPYFLGLAGLPRAPRGDAPAAPPAMPSSAHGAAAAAPSWPAEPAREPLPPSAVPGSATEFRRPQVAPGDPPSRSLFDAGSIRKDFPILRERVHGRPLVWLDNAATTQKPQSVIDRLSYYYEHENSNVHRAAHALAARATDAFEGARDTVRRFLNAPSAQEIVLLRGTTEAINLVAQSWGRRNVRPGDEIIITWLEHHANIVPWQQLCAETGACLRVVPVDDRGQVSLEAYERLLGPKTRLVAVSQVSNALGTVVPVREMTEMAHRRGALALVDGAQAVSHMRVDVQALDCDFYCFSGHKVFGPTGIGVLYGKHRILEQMPPWQGGGNMISDVTFEKTTYQPPPQRFEAGTNSIADAVGLGAALDYLSALGIENVSRHEHELLEYGTERLAQVPGLRMIGTAREKAGVLSFVLDGVRTEDIGTALDQEGIAVRSGHHCAQPILRRFGLESTVRASLAPYNTRADLDALAGALQRLSVGSPRVGRSTGP